MAHLHKKIKKGRPYYYIREIARVDGKPKVVNPVYLGSPERIREMALDQAAPQLKTPRGKPRGVLLMQGTRSFC